jgi:hypothetical protein
MSFSKIQEKIKNKIWSRIKDFFHKQRVVCSPLVLNINYNCYPDQKKALICYVAYGYFTDLGNPGIGRTQPFEIMKIVSSFSALGYVIDIIKYNDIKSYELIKNKKYDLIFGFGEAFYQLTNLQPTAISILYMTENHPEFSYREEKKRLDYFYERHRRKIKITRSGRFYKTYHLNKIYSHIITMSETKPLESLYHNPHTIFPTGITNPKYTFEVKDHLHARKNFLWLGSSGAVHKGLDLLLDVFNQRNNIILHICGLGKIERENLNIQRTENIVEYGFIDIKSDIFLELVDMCSFIILPSCSEACSTSITTGMLHGLIPIVIRDTGFNRLGDNAIFLEDFKVDYINLKLNEFSNFDPDRLTILSRQAFGFARQNFTIQAFENSFKDILTDILKTKE